MIPPRQAVRTQVEQGERSLTPREGMHSQQVWATLTVQQRRVVNQAFAQVCLQVVQAVARRELLAGTQAAGEDKDETSEQY